MSLRVNTNYPAVPAEAVITELNKMDPFQLRRIESCRASSRNNENLSVLFSKHNVWHQALPSACLHPAALPARGKACGSLVRDLVRKKAKTIGVPRRKDLRANQKRFTQNLTASTQDPHPCPCHLMRKRCQHLGPLPVRTPEYCALSSKIKSVSWPSTTLSADLKEP